MTPYSSKKGNSKSERRKKNTKEIVVKKLRWCLWDKVKVGGIVGFISGFGFGNFNIKSVCVGRDCTVLYVYEMRYLLVETIIG